MRRLALTFLALLGVLLAPVPTVSAQEPPVVRLTLLEQTPWNSSFDETNARELFVRFRAENLGSVSIDGLAIGVTLYGRLLSRSAFEESLLADPLLPLKGETRPREGTIEPGQTRDFELTFLLDELAGLDPDQSGVYPLKIDLRSGFTSLGAIRTPVVFLVRQPEIPLRLSWTFVLHHPIEFGPGGEFTSTELETALAPGGRLGAQIRALQELAVAPTQPAVDVAVSPVLLTQLARMRDGYEVLVGDEVLAVDPGEGGAKLAGEALVALEEIAGAPNVRVSAMPFAAPELPSLVAGGLGRDLRIQLDRGRALVEEMLTTPVAGVLRPPGAALDDETLRELPGVGVSTLLVGPATVETTPQPLGLAGPPAASLSESGVLRAVVPDPAVASMLQSGLGSSDPVRAAQVVLGEIASIWQERPGELRGIALILSEDSLLPAPFFAAFTRSIASAPWLTPMHAGEFATAFAPPEPSSLDSPSLRAVLDVVRRRAEAGAATHRRIPLDARRAGNRARPPRDVAAPRRVAAVPVEPGGRARVHHRCPRVGRCGVRSDQRRERSGHHAHVEHGKRRPGHGAQRRGGGPARQRPARVPRSRPRRAASTSCSSRATNRP